RGVPLADTIYGCRDIRKFIRVRGTKGGATWMRPDQGDMIGAEKQLVGGVHLGRAVRWYYARDSRDYIVDSESTNKVAGSDGARPVMELPAQMPEDVDYHYYVTVASKMLDDIGYGKENQ